MTASRMFFSIVLMLLCLGTSMAAFQPLRTDVTGDKPEAVIITQNDREVQLEIKVPGVELTQGILDGKKWDRVLIPGGGFDLEMGAPETPHFTRLLIIPAMAGVHASFEAMETVTIPNIILMPAQGRDPQDMQSQPVKFDMTRYSRNELYPSQRVMMDEPAIMRGLRVVSLRTNPVQYNPVTHELVVTTKYRVTVHFDGQDLRNVPARQITLSPSWAKLVKAGSFNYDDEVTDVSNSGSYLIVCPNIAALISDLQPLIDWKNREGHAVTLQTFAVGSTNTQVKALIQTAYNTWPIPPEYVMLVGDVTGSYILPAWSGVDHSYAQLDGSDILADVALGRLPTTTQTQTQTMVNKVLFYEKMPYIGDPGWFSRSGLVGYYAASLSFIEVNRWIKTQMVNANFTQIDTLWYGMSGNPGTFMTNKINNGVSFINYRGWIGMGGFTNNSMDALTNGHMLPFATCLTCGTGGFQGGSSGNASNMEYFVQVGTPTTPKGAIACTGLQGTSTEPPQNNTLDYGVYAGLFLDGNTQAGTAVNRGKLELYNSYEINYQAAVNNWSNWCSLAGDPGVELFTGAIQFMTCNFPHQVTYGQNSMSFTVNKQAGSALAGATVCLYKAGELQSVGITNVAGQVTLPMTVSGAGNVKVTITNHNYFPIVDSLDVVNAAVAVGYERHTVDDDNVGGTIGDNDHIVNPGETVDLPMTFKNYGTSTTATGISMTASETDNYVSLTNVTQTFPDLAPGASGNSSGAVRMIVSPMCPNNHVVQLAFNTTANEGSWTGGLALNVATFFAKINSVTAQGSDTLLSPGETANVQMTIKNLGGKTATNLTATVTSLDPLVTVNDNSASFGTVAVGATATCSANPFNLTASPFAAPGHYAQLKVSFSGNLATQPDTTIILKLGAKSTTDPQGPDHYGYYCFDNTDVNYAQHPVYNWVEIDPTYGGSGTQLGLNDYAENADTTTLVNLPFTFHFYGQWTNQIAVCSNGWLSTTPDISYNDFRNYQIPSPIGPSGKICPFWDDLVTSPGHVFVWNDATNHRFIVEWSRMNVTSYTPTTTEVFEAILYDAAYYPTPTGDGEIIFQYYSIADVPGVSPGQSGYEDNRYSTVGIENPNHLDGIQVVYWNNYTDPAVAHLQNGRAYKFTTNLTYGASGAHVTLTPVSPPITIPASGGSFQFNAQIQNTNTTPASFAVWIMQYTPGGIWQGPMLGPVNLTIPGSLTISRLRTQNVPGSAAPGTYTYRGYVGIYSNLKWDSSSFDYTKSTTGSGPLVGNWDNWGESFAPYLTGEEPTAVEMPSVCRLDQNYPNPFNPSTAISYQLSANSHVTMRVYDLAGRLVTTLVDGQKVAGTHQVTFDGSKLSSGLYFVRMQAGDFSQVRKMMLVK